MNPSKTNLEAEVSMQKSAVEVPEDPPFHMLVLGDLSGGHETVGRLSALRIDRDDFESVLKRVRPKVILKGEDDSEYEIFFESLDDFHPDSLFRNVGLFDELRDVRRRLTIESTFRGAASEVRNWFSDSDMLNETEPVESAAALIPEKIEGEGLLDDILGIEDEGSGGV